MMFGVPLPWAGFAVALAAVVMYVTGHHYGWAERDAEMQIEIAKKNEEARVLEQRLIVQVNENATKLMEANHALDEKQSALTAAIRAGRVRLPAPSCVQASPSAAPTPTSSPETGSESDRATLEAIAAIVADGDRAINQLNACIDSYSQVMEQINGNR